MAHESDRVTSNDLGDAIRSYRKRRYQIHNGAPWSQEDLAVAIGSDKSHINRIERGHSMPARETLERLSSALELSWPERARLFGLAGYIVEEPEPTVNEIEGVRKLVSPVLAASTYGLLLQDHAMRIWDINNVYAIAFAGFRDRESCLGHIRGQTVVDQILDPRVGRWFRDVVVDYPSFVRRALIRYLHAYRARLTEEPVALIVERLQRHPDCRAIWDELLQRSDSAATVYLDHHSVRIKHPVFGDYSVRIWHSTLALDNRFFLSHHIPSDALSQSLLEGIALHGYTKEGLSGVRRVPKGAGSQAGA